jgi:hypothetical protein
VERSSWKLEALGGSETRPTWKERMAKVDRKRTAGEVVNSQRKTRATAVTAKRIGLGRGFGR